MTQHNTTADRALEQSPGFAVQTSAVGAVLISWHTGVPESHQDPLSLTIATARSPNNQRKLVSPQQQKERKGAQEGCWVATQH